MKVIKGVALLCLLMLAGCQSEEETSQFLLACKYDAPATIEAMLNNGIDVDGQDKTGLSGLMVAAAENRRDVVALLLKRQAKPNLQTRQGACIFLQDKPALLCFTQKRAPSLQCTENFYFIIFKNAYRSVIH